MSVSSGNIVGPRGGGGFASPDIPISEADGSITPEWYRQLVEMYQHSGLALAEYQMWDSTVVDGCSVTLDDVDPPTLTTFVSPAKLYSFDNAVTSIVHGSVLLPGDYIDGTDLYPFVRWAPSSTDTGNCRWTLDYTFGSEGSAFAANVSENITPAGSGTANQHQVSEWTKLDGAALDIQSGDCIGFQLKRQGAAEPDSFTGNAFLLAVGFHHLVGVPGRNGRTR